MHTPQTIVLIGAGELGRGIAFAMAGGHDRVLVCDHSQQTKELVADLQKSNPYYDVEATDCFYEASWEADVIILDLPCADLSEAAGRIKAVANQKVVVSADAVTALQELLPNSKVVQAFSSLQPSSFYLPVEERKQINCLITGVDKEAVQVVVAIVNTLGFTPEVASQQVPAAA